MADRDGDTIHALLYLAAASQYMSKTMPASPNVARTQAFTASQCGMLAMPWYSGAWSSSHGRFSNNANITKPDSGSREMALARERLSRTEKRSRSAGSA